MKISKRRTQATLKRSENVDQLSFPLHYKFNIIFSKHTENEATDTMHPCRVTLYPHNEASLVKNID